MLKQILILAMLFSIPIFAQNGAEQSKSSTVLAINGEQILQNARKAIGTENIDINSYSMKFKSSFDTGSIINEIKVLLPDKINLIEDVTMKTFSSLNTSIWNGEKYKAISERNISGERFVTDITDTQPNKKLLTKIGDKIGKEKVAKYKVQDSKEFFYYEVWKLFFPLTIIQPFEQNLIFKFVGKTKSGTKFANVVDVNSKNGKTYHLVFDIETNYLLMIIQSYRGETKFTGEKGVYETKYYYLTREKMGNLLIPKKIKVEYKFTPDGKEPKFSYENIEILDFQINPKFKESVFEIK